MVIIPTELIAEPITTNITTNNATLATVQPVTTIPDIMRLDSHFDWSVFLGIPFWVFITIFFAMIVGIVFLYWHFRMRRMASVKGYVEAMVHAQQWDVMVWIIDATRRLTIECMKMTDGVLSFYDKKVIIRWFHDERNPPLNIGGVGGVICSEGFFRTRDMVAEIARDTACDDFNHNLETYGEELKRPCAPISDSTAYKTFGRELLETLNPDGLWIPSYCLFDSERDNKYKPRGLTARFNGGIFIRQARKLNLGMRVMGWLERHLALGIIVTIGLIAIIAAWMCPMGGV